MIPKEVFLKDHQPQKEELFIKHDKEIGASIERSSEPYAPAFAGGGVRLAPVKNRDDRAKHLERLFRIVGGLVTIASLPLPFMSSTGYSLYGRVSEILSEIVPMFTYFITKGPEVVPLTVIAAYVLLILGSAFLLIGGLFCLWKGTLGGIIGLIGLAMETAAFSLIAGFSPQMLVLAGPGYYAALAGSMTAVLSRWFRVQQS